MGTLAKDSSCRTLSIVTPSFNQGSFIEEAITSVARENASNVEHIIVDGGSTDETIRILEMCSRIPTWQHVRWSSRTDGGQSEAINRGILQSTGDVIGWLNSDDRYRHGCFELVKNVFADNPDIDVIYGDYTVMNEAGETLKVRREIEFNRFVLKYHRVLYISTAATFFRRKIFTQGNWLNERLHYAMDFDFFVRLAAGGYRFKHIPELLADMRIHPKSKSCATPAVMLQEQESLMRHHSSISKKIRSPVLQKIAFDGARVTAGALRYGEKLIRGYYRVHSMDEFTEDNVSGSRRSTRREIL